MLLLWLLLLLLSSPLVLPMPGALVLIIIMPTRKLLYANRRALTIINHQAFEGHGGSK